MTRQPLTHDASRLVAEWPFPNAAALGSAVRAQGIERELRARLPWALRGHLQVEAGLITLTMDETERAAFEEARAILADVLAGIETLPVLPREADDILTITPRERLKWTKDGRLQSAGTRTVKLRGRAKAVTFHVFEPRHIEDVLDRDLPSLWRQEDEEAATEARRRRAAKAASTRAAKGQAKNETPAVKPARRAGPPPKLEGWDAFDAEGLLR